MILLVVAAVLGGLCISAFSYAIYGLWITFCITPIGASLIVLAMAMVLMYVRGLRQTNQEAQDEPQDERRPFVPWSGTNGSADSLLDPQDDSNSNYGRR